MWEQYRKTFLATQGVIITVSLLMYFLGGRPPLLSIFFFFIMMEIFGMLGVLWGMRLRRKANAARTNSLPLDRR
jgi:predicted MFS family arabinose efflux permease